MLKALEIITLVALFGFMGFHTLAPEPVPHPEPVPFADNSVIEPLQECWTDCWTDINGDVHCTTICI